MNSRKALRFSAGVTVMLGTFLLLYNVSKYQTIFHEAKYAFGNNQKSYQTSLIDQTSPIASPPKNIVEGFFDVEREGDLKDQTRENGKIVTKHYRAIHSDKLLQTDNPPTLKLQVFDNNQKSWIVTEVTKVSEEDGTIFFLLKTEQEQDIAPNDFYTGTYQLIFDN